MNDQVSKKLEMKRAEEFLRKTAESGDKYYRHCGQTRPITDIKYMLETSALLFGDSTAFLQRYDKKEPFKEISYNEMMSDINSLGTALLGRGFKDARVAVIGENCYEWGIAYLTAMSGVGVTVPLDRELSSAEIRHFLDVSEAKCVFFTKKYEKMFLELQKETGLELLVNVNNTADEEQGDGVLVNINSLYEEGKKLLDEGNRDFLDAKIVADEMAVMLFTSGTTGTSKAVMLSHTNLCTQLMGAPCMIQMQPGERFLLILPLHHTYACTCSFLMGIYMGSPVAFCEGTKYIQKNLKEIQPSYLLAVPVIFESLYKAITKNIKKSGKEDAVNRIMKLNSITSKAGLNINKRLLKDITGVFGGKLKVLISGGAPIAPEILDYFNQFGFYTVQGYGLTECSPLTAINVDSHKLMISSSVGHIFPGTVVKIIDKDESGIGEICFKGPGIMLGYYNMPEETANAIVDGWFHTGDIGYLDDEQNIYITGRKKNVIITRNGKNVFPEELEYYLHQVPYVEEAFVWADSNDEGQDAVIVATIRPNMEEVTEALGEEKAEDAEEITKLLWNDVDKINEMVPSFKMIKRINLRFEEFEKTTTKKIKRFIEGNR